MKSEAPDFAEVLREAGHKATSSRILLLNTLWKESKPVTVAYLQKVMKGAMDRVTLYRALESLVESGIVQHVDLRHGHAHYEYSKKHHHHLVCTDCGIVKDFEGCNYKSLADTALKQTTGFAAVNSHSLELFGLCNTCFKS